MNKVLKIGILGSRGIPNRYGGYEQCAEYLAAGLAEKGHEVYVYNSHNHEYQGSTWNGVHIIHCNDPEHKMGTAGQFIYDLNCIRDARRRAFDIVLQLGYTSSSVWWWYWPAEALNLVNMDGLEWKRSKYSKKVQWFLKHAERWAAMHGNGLIADSLGIQQHLKDVYKKDSVFIPYGAEIFESPTPEAIQAYNLQPFSYDLLIARMEPENNIEMIIRGHQAAGGNRPLVVVGKTDNSFGTYLKTKYSTGSNILFTGGIYEKDAINNLRYYSYLYFHGHSVGGTNPSLLEAMACNALIAAHDNVFNRTVLGDDAFCFSDSSDVSRLVVSVTDRSRYKSYQQNNLQKIRDRYSWPRIVHEYEQMMLQAMTNKQGQ
ncbi:DUF1972 domain-containing protein [Chitinophagaceae bacterium MMS25-I14]